MNRIEELLEEICPEGVEFLLLGSACEIRSGWGFPNKYQGNSNGLYPFYKVSDMNSPGNETVMRHANNYINDDLVKRLSVNLAPSGTVIFPKIGAAIRTNKKRKLSCLSAYNNNIIGLIPKEFLLSGFLLHWIMTKNLADFSDYSGAIPSIRKTTLENIEIPIPPLAIQQEIVKILDKFVELQAELQARKTQYEYYRNALLTFPEQNRTEQNRTEQNRTEQNRIMLLFFLGCVNCWINIAHKEWSLNHCLK